MQTDRWQAEHPDEPDPLGEEPTAETPAPEPEPQEEPAPEPLVIGKPDKAEPDPAEDKTEAPEPEPEVAPEPGTPEEADWKRRHDALRDTQRRTAEERNDAIRQRDEALSLARQVYEDTQRRVAAATPAPATTTVDPNVEAMRAEAANLGITDEQFAFMQKLADTRASEQVGAVQTQYTQDQEQQRQQLYLQRVADDRMKVVNTFRTAHPDAVELEEDIFEVLREVGMVNERNEFDQPELRIDHLEAAYEAAKDPELRRELRANPQWYDTDEGMDYARRQASLAKLLSKATPVTSSSSLADSEAAVAAAETLPASGGPPPGTGGPPADAFDEVLEYDKKARSNIFN